MKVKVRNSKEDIMIFLQVGLLIIISGINIASKIFIMFTMISGKRGVSKLQIVPNKLEINIFHFGLSNRIILLTRKSSNEFITRLSIKAYST